MKRERRVIEKFHFLRRTSSLFASIVRDGHWDPFWSINIKLWNMNWFNEKHIKVPLILNLTNHDKHYLRNCLFSLTLMSIMWVSQPLWLVMLLWHLTYWINLPFWPLETTYRVFTLTWLLDGRWLTGGFPQQTELITSHFVIQESVFIPIEIIFKNCF